MLHYTVGGRTRGLVSRRSTMSQRASVYFTSRSHAAASFADIIRREKSVVRHLLQLIGPLAWFIYSWRGGRRIRCTLYHSRLLATSSQPALVSILNLAWKAIHLGAGFKLSLDVIGFAFYVPPKLITVEVHQDLSIAFLGCTPRSHFPTFYSNISQLTCQSPLLSRHNAQVFALCECRGNCCGSKPDL